MKPFDIRDHITTGKADSKGYVRGRCPSCALQISSKGKDKSKNTNLTISPEGAYKCHAGCVTKDIRNALGQPKDRPAPPPQIAPKGSLNDAQVAENQERLKLGEHCLTWLLDRGLDAMAIDHYRLGASRCKTTKGHLPAITIPIPDGQGTYYAKKRIAPWLNDPDLPKWSQYGVSSTIWVTHDATEQVAQYWLVEGEWDAIALGWAIKQHPVLSEIITVATATTGAGNVPPGQEIDLWMPVQEAPIVTWFDLDKAGREGAAKWRSKLGQRVAIGNLALDADEFDGLPLPDGFDMSDALTGGVNLDDLVIEAARAIAEISTTSDQPPTAKKEANPLRSRLQINDAFVGSAPDYVDWLVDEILTPNELFVLGMPPRGGKSLFGLTLAKAVATGGTFLDRPVSQGSVVYVNLEDGPTKIKIRQRQQGWAEGLPVYWLDRFKLSELPHLQELVAEIGDVRLVILDTLSRVRDDGLDESSSRLSKILEPLQEWCGEAGLCCVMMHHTRQASTDGAVASDPFDNLRGSTAIRATCRGAIVIVPGTDNYRLISENGFSDRLDLNVRLNPETLEWKLLGNWEPRIDGGMREQIMDQLAHSGPATVAQIARQLSFNAQSVSTIMARLHRDDLVTKSGGHGRTPATYSRSVNLLKVMGLDKTQQSLVV